MRKGVKLSKYTQRLRKARDRLHQAVAGLTEGEAETKLGDDSWTIRETIAHLASAEEAQRTVMEILVAKGGYRFKPFDRDVWNEKEVRRRDGRSLDQLLAEFDETREKTIEFAREATEDKLQIEGHHPLWGDITPASVLERILWHQEKHTAEIETARRESG